MLKVNNKDTERRHLRRTGVFIVNFEHISQLLLVFSLLTLYMELPAGLVLTPPLLPLAAKCC